MSWGPSRWIRETAAGYWRSGVLVVVSGIIPALTVVVAVFGLSFSRSWSADLHAPALARLAAAVGEWGIAVLWALGAFNLAMIGLGRPAAEYLRRCSGLWSGVEIPSLYRPPRPVTKVSTGYWWDGADYHESEREAKAYAWLMERNPLMSSQAPGADPQTQRDMLWQVTAALTVVPAAALPFLLGAGAIYAAVVSAGALWVGLLAAGSVACAPFAWRVFPPVASRLLAAGPDSATQEQVARLNSIRADLTQTQAAELERIERSLHDGAQARMVALGMHLSAAERLVDSDPEQAKRILRQARVSSAAALDQLRTLVRGINPPVLIERGLVDAVRALALDSPVEIEVQSSLAGRLEQPIEAALYFAVAELLTNVVKHAHASRAVVELSYGSGVVRVVVSDDGTGGAVASPGSGLEGLACRVGAFDGGVDINSPHGGPTRVSLTVPCELS